MREQGTPLEPAYPPSIPVQVSSVGDQKAWRQPREGRAPYTRDMLLLALAVITVSILYLKFIHCTYIVNIMVIVPYTY